MTTIATFQKDPKMRAIILEFKHPNLHDPDISAMLRKFEKDLQEVGEDPNYDFLIIKTDEGVGSSGGVYSLFLEELNVKEISRWEKILLYIERIRKVTIMALPHEVDDTLFQMALVCDYCMCLPDTKFKFSAIKSGFLPGMAVFRLTKYVGLGNAKRILYKGLTLTPKKALQSGIVEEIVSDLHKGINHRINSIKEIQIEPTIMARLIMNESYHDSYEEEIGNYLAAQVRCAEKIKKFTKVKS